MSGTRARAIATLVRWRDFEESRACADFRRDDEQARDRAQHVAQAQAEVDDVRGYRARLQTAPSLDLGRILLVAQIEDEACERLRLAQEEAAAAEQRRAAALARHAQARAKSRVGQTRLRAARAAEAEAGEKRLFDWMADIHRTRKASHD